VRCNTEQQFFQVSVDAVNMILFDPDIVCLATYFLSAAVLLEFRQKAKNTGYLVMTKISIDKKNNK
jgi:hypothetical protein